MAETYSILPIPSTHKFKDLTGQRFSRLNVIGYAGSRRTPSGQPQAQWWCRCDCGTVKRIRGVALKTGFTRSCGCYKSEVTGRRRRSHADSNSPEYRTWANMHQRCRCKSGPDFALYAARGIRVCERWHNYALFLEDMGRKPTSSHSIDRIDLNGNYDPGNCRWATLIEQANNKRNNLLITYRGRTQTLPMWCRELGISLAAIRSRIDRGWPLELAMSPKRFRRPNSKCRPK